MPVSVRQTTNEDAEELAHIWLHSLEDNDMVKLASREGITPERLAGATRKTREDLDDPNALCLTAYDSETRAVMGCAVWRYFPNGKPLPVDVPPGTDKDESSGQREGNAKGTTVYPSISKDLEEASNKIFMKHVGRRPHASLCKLQVSPKYERKGVGTILIQHGLEKTSLPSYHFSTPKAARVYEKHGYEEIDRVVLDLEVYGGAKAEMYISPFYFRQGTQFT